MNEYLLIIAICIGCLAIYMDLYRVRQMETYLEQNKKILDAMETKIKEMQEIQIALSNLEGILE